MRLSEEIIKECEALNLGSAAIHQQVVKWLVKGFKVREGSKKKKAFELLSLLFSQFDFDLPQFCLHYHIEGREKERFLSDLLKYLYYYELSLSLLYPLRSQSFLNAFFLIIWAEGAKRRRVDQTICSFSEKERIALIFYSFSIIREGSWRILSHLKSTQTAELIEKLWIGYYDLSYLETLLERDLSFGLIISELEKQALQQIQEVVEWLPKVIEQIIHSPQLVFKSFQGTEGMGSLIEGWEGKVEKVQDDLRKQFAPYFPFSYSFEELKEFFSLFGLRGYSLPKKLLEQAGGSLKEILESLFLLFQSPQSSSPFQQLLMVQFIKKICQQLHTYHRNPILYVNGLHRIVYTMATAKENLEDLPWLPSVVEGLKAIEQHLNKKKIPHPPFSSLPIIIFDQNSPQAFSKNARYILKLAKQHSLSIWHLSIEQTLKLADRLGVIKWIQTNPEACSKNLFGYGGSRNCLFFLAPVIFMAVQDGIEDFQELMALPEPRLRLFFEEAVLGKDGKDLVIHTGEDDLAIPHCNFFADALFAIDHQSRYFYRSSYCWGRSTSNIPLQLDLESLLCSPFSLFASTYWETSLWPGAMKGLLTKPKFCLPLPFGNEECHVMSLERGYDFFQQPIIHLAGTRFPKRLFPTSPLEGIVDSLKAFLPYAFHTYFSNHLIETTQESIRKASWEGLPWNDRENLSFSSLKDLLAYVSSEKIQIEIKRRFWIHFADLFGDNTEESSFLKKALEKLAERSDSSFAPYSLKKYYRDLGRDASMTLALGRAILLHHNKKESKCLEKVKAEVEQALQMKIAETQLAKGLYLLIEKILNFGSQLGC